MKACWVALASAAVAAANISATALPIYLEDNHVGTFYWLAQHVDLDEPCTLIHFDAHSDASAVFDSDKIREALRNVVSPEDRQSLLDKWRDQGAVQCFNWIEPLMPAPIAKVIWVPAEKLSAAETSERRRDATTLLEGHLEAAPRQAGSLRERYLVSDFASLPRHLSPHEPLIVTIDLDYFAGCPADEQEKRFSRIWNFVRARPNLRAVTFAISRPYLNDDHEADRLLRLALGAALALPTAQIEFEPFSSVAHDRSERAKQLQRAGKTPPVFDVAQISQELRARILAENDRILVRHDSARWQQLVRSWRDDAPQLHLAVKDRQPSTDGVWRIPATEEMEIELVVEPWTTAPANIEWFALVPAYSHCNATDLTVEQVGFVANAAARPAWNEIPISFHDSILPLGKIDIFFDRQMHCGSLRLRARAVVDGAVRETPVLELRRFIGSGFRAAVSEQFGLPYIFGSGGLAEKTDTGPETNLGADCANFVVYALRRQGLRFPWSDPKQLEPRLDLMARSTTAGAVKINAADLQRGLIVHLGTHVAAVVDDRPPTGILDANDLVAHQLKGVPGVLTLGELLRERKKTSFDLLRVPAANPHATILFGGDVMLGRSCAAKIDQGVDPFAEVANVLRGASLAAANLECTISELGSSGPRYAFRAPPSSAALLRRAGFRALGLANNHALDFGPAALHDCAARLSRENVAALGLASEQESAYAAKFFSLPDEKKLALLAVTDVESGMEADGQIAQASERARLGAAIARARLRANLVVCLVHWGIENGAQVTGEQRELARWLVDHGVDIVVGSHPHCVQPLDFYHGCPIAYSLGNLVFDGAPGIASWNQGALLEFILVQDGALSCARLIPVALKDGLPFIAAPEDNQAFGHASKLLTERGAGK